MASRSLVFVPKRLLSGLLALLCTAILSAPSVWAVIPPHVDRSALQPTKAQVRATELITNFIANYHYKKVSLNDALSEQIFDRYLDALDPNHSYLLDQDVVAFSVHRDNIDDYLKHAQLQPAFSMFLTFRDRVEQRTRYIVNLLNTDFDFTKKETYSFDRSKQPWADQSKLDSYWRKRVKNDVLSLLLAGKAEKDIKKTLKARYEDIMRRTDQLNADDVYELFVNAYLSSIEPHTSYFSPRTSENFRIRMSLSLEGIGAILQSDNDYTLVKQVLKGGPASKTGLLHDDDRITGVGQGLTDPVVDVVGWRLDDVVDLIRGKSGSKVRLQILPKGVGPEGPTKLITLTRGKIELEDEAAKQSVIEVKNGDHSARIGVITLPTFYQDFEARARGDENYRSTTRDVRKLLAELAKENVEGIVIDLRGDGGGSLSEATELTGLFVGSGPVVQVRNSDGTLHIERNTEPVIAYSGPLAVLVDGNSASASEIFAGAIQDYKRGVIIGEPTFGKGTVQNLVDLDQYDHEDGGGLGQLKATIAQFFRVDGDSTQHRGVVPDIKFPTELNPDDEGERALPNALPWAHIDPANFVPARAPIAQFAEARIRHDQRIKNDRAFQILLDEEHAVKAARSRTTVSLVESQRKTELERVEKQQKEREREFRAAVGLPPLKNDESPKADEKNVDLVLKETARVLDDLVFLPPTRQAWVTNGKGLAEFNF